MEEKKKETQPLGKGQAEKSKMANVAGHVVGGAGIGAAAYAYGAHRTTTKEETVDSGKDVKGQDIPKEEPIEEVTIQAEETVETSQEEVVVEPEPIVHTDGIDFELQVNELPEEVNVEGIEVGQPSEDVEVFLVDVPEPDFPGSDDAGGVIIIDEPVRPEEEILIDPVLPEDELFADGNSGINPDDIVINDIGSDIHQDLMG